MERQTATLMWLSRLSKYTLVDVFAVIGVLVGVQLRLDVGGGKCVEWLGKVARGTTWESEMDKLEADWLDKQAKKARSTKRLF